MDKKITRPIGTFDESSIKKSCEFMNELLADEFTLFTKTLNYHWNVTGPRFHSIHKFLETQYNELLVVMDDIAERVRILGERPVSTVKGMTKNRNLKEEDRESMSSNDMLYDLLSAHIQIQNEIKEFVSDETIFKKDPGTEDFLVGLLQKHEMNSWMLKSHLDY